MVLTEADEKFLIDDVLWQLVRHNEELRQRLEEKEAQEQASIRRRRSTTTGSPLRRLSPQRLRSALPATAAPSETERRSKSPFLFRRGSTDRDDDANIHHHEHHHHDDWQQRGRSNKPRAKSPFKFRKQKTEQTQEPEKAEAAPKNSNRLLRPKSPFKFRRRAAKEQASSEVLTRIQVVVDEDARKEMEASQQEKITKHQQRSKKTHFQAQPSEAKKPHARDRVEQDRTRTPSTPRRMQRSTTNDKDTGCYASLLDLTVTTPTREQAQPAKKQPRPQPRTPSPTNDMEDTAIRRKESRDVLLDLQQEEAKTYSYAAPMKRDHSSGTLTKILSEDDGSAFTAIFDPNQEIEKFYESYRKTGFDSHRTHYAAGEEKDPQETGFFEVLGRNMDGIHRTWCSDVQKTRREEPSVIKRRYYGSQR